MEGTRALQDLAPNQAECSGLSSSQQVTAPLTKGKKTSSHASTTFTPHLGSLTRPASAVAAPGPGRGHPEPALTIWMTDTGPMLFT